MESLPVSYSKMAQTRLVLPPDTNHLDTIFGGKVLAYIDEIAALTAMKHSNSVVVTASIDSVDFLSSAKVGDALTLEASITRTGRTSMEVYVKVYADDLLRGRKVMTTESFLTMVAVDTEGNPKSVPFIIPETEEEKRLYNTAPSRKALRRNRSALR
ncbi:acyl-CoA thioesterase [Lentibacillus sp. CBA3610]|uniref:acyl-CoA thioesterase n=1 Tax=Lentibacillus sp. CBA3610 TaxID=2518176 RepID=UPI0015954363|nr:acyl-CoA thioesterase [Lentibacillus sp. CBA3610]QKY69355.1 acyl-CoA thioesterase [Lentibacillus sp. CBA3610]